MKKRETQILIYTKIKKYFFILFGKDVAILNESKKNKSLTITNNESPTIEHDDEYANYYTKMTRWQTI